MQEIRIGMVGIGTVGGGVLKILKGRMDHFRNDLGLPLRVTRIVDMNEQRFAGLPIEGAVCSTDVQDVLRDDAISIVVELIGGTTFAKELVLAALARKKHVVTANKALLAVHGSEVFETAAKHGVSVYFEASVGGGIPLIKTVREGLIANDIVSIKTIINGTCNYILTKMAAEGQSFESVLKKAQTKGYAEGDPTIDVSGADTGHKVAILASLASGSCVPFDGISIEGITGISKDNITFARELGYTIKLLGIIKKDAESGLLDVRVHPAMLPVNHILSSVSDVYNAVLLEGDAVGQIFLYGRGAGELPAGSAVMSDIVDVARNIMGNAPVRIPMNYYASAHRARIKPIDSIVTRYYLHFSVKDRPGVFASIAGSLGAAGISLTSVMQKKGTADKGVPVIILTHPANENKLRAALTHIETLDYIKGRTQIIRIEE